MLKSAAVIAAALLTAGTAWAGPEAAGALMMHGPASVGMLGAALIGAGLAVRPRGSLDA